MRTVRSGSPLTPRRPSASARLRWGPSAGIRRGLVLGVLAAVALGTAGHAGARPPALPPSLAAATTGVALDVRFAERSEVRGSDARIAAATPARRQRITAQLRAQGAVTVQPLVGDADQVHASRVTARARIRSGRRNVPDLASWYRVVLPADADVDAALAALRSSPDVDHAERAPDAAPPPSTPDFTAQQRYLRPAPVGTDADFAHGDPRTRGAGVRIVDLEYYATFDHEDLLLPPARDLGGSLFPQYTVFADEHGTAVLGVMVGRDNDFGVTGGVPDAQAFLISPTRSNGGGVSYQPAAALATLAVDGHVSPGDVVLIEQQAVGPAGGSSFVPLEWSQASYDVIRVLTDLGVVVVETGGNGGQDLDGTNMLGRFDRTVRDSGAIVVGAGHPDTRVPLDFSSYGSRVDLQGPGLSVVTTGGSGNLLNTAVTSRYTSQFSGTSAAGPVVVNAVVAVQSYVRATGQAPWSADRIRDLLRATGTPQGGDGARQIGPLPDARAALRAIEVDPPTSDATLVGATITLTADDGWGSGVARIEHRADGGSWETYGGPIPWSGVGVLEHRAVDGNGNAGALRRLVVDETAPTVVIDSPVAGAAYPEGAAVPAAFSCRDEADGSGVASCVGTVASSAPLDTATPGPRTFTVVATDRAGNQRTETVGYQVTASPAIVNPPVVDPPIVNPVTPPLTPPTCPAHGVALLSVAATGTARRPRVRLTGTAGRVLAGQPVVVRRDGRRVATGSVRTDGRISLTVAAPRSQRARNAARYRLEVAAHRSALARTTAPVRISRQQRLADGRVRVTGRLTDVTRRRTLAVRTQTLCSAGSGSTSSTPLRTDRRGRFRVTLPAPAAGQRAVPQVRLPGGTTVTLPVVLDGL